MKSQSVEKHSSASFKILEKNRRESQIRELKDSNAVKQRIRMYDVLNPHQHQTQRSKAKKQPLGLETELCGKSQPNVSTYRMRELARSWYCFRDGSNIIRIVFLRFILCCLSEKWRTHWCDLKRSVLLKCRVWQRGEEGFSTVANGSFSEYLSCVEFPMGTTKKLAL